MIGCGRLCRWFEDAFWWEEVERVRYWEVGFGFRSPVRVLRCVGWPFLWNACLMLLSSTPLRSCSANRWASLAPLPLDPLMHALHARTRAVAILLLAHVKTLLFCIFSFSAVADAILEIILFASAPKAPSVVIMKGTNFSPRLRHVASYFIFFAFSASNRIVSVGFSWYDCAAGWQIRTSTWITFPSPSRIRTWRSV